MSLFAILYIADDLTPEQAMSKLFPDGKTPAELRVSATVVPPKTYILETTGVPARLEVYFALDKEHAGAARRALGAAARALVGTSEGDMILMYNDTPVIRRVGSTREYARDYPGLEIPGWNSVETIRIPRHSFTFTVRRATKIAGVITLDGVLDGKLVNGARASARKSDGETISIVVKTVAFVDPPKADRHTTVTIEPPTCALESLEGVTLVGD